jgi:hypothetical protein
MCWASENSRWIILSAFNNPLSAGTDASRGGSAMPTSSFVINPPPLLAGPSLIGALQSVATPHISDNLHRLTGIIGLQRFHRSKKLVGTAFTVTVRPGDNLFIYKALMETLPGHVLFVDGGGELTNALVADRLLQAVDQTVKFEQIIKDEIATGAVEQSWLSKALGPHGLL